MHTTYYKFIIQYKPRKETNVPLELKDSLYNHNTYINILKRSERNLFTRGEANEGYILWRPDVIKDYVFHGLLHNISVKL